MKYNFCVVTQPRSGDELLISKLRSHPNIYITLGKPYSEFLEQTNFTVFSEYLEKYKFQQQNYNLKYTEQDIAHSLNTREYMEQYYSEQIKIGCIPANHSPQISTFLDQIYGKDREKRKSGYESATQLAVERYTNYGLTVYSEHILNNGCLEDIVSDKARYIILFRENLLWQYVSTLLPTTTNEHGYTKIHDTKLTIERTEFENYVSNTLRERSKIKEVVRNTGCEYIEISYEDLTKNNRETLDKIQEFLNVPIQEQELYGINPDNIYEETRPLETIIINYESIKSELKDSDLFKFFKMAEDAVNPFYYEIRKAGTFKSLDFLRDMSIGKP